MSWDDLTDSLVDALRTVILSRVNAALLTALGKDFPAIVDTYGYPIPTEQIPETRLPAIAVYRLRGAVEKRGRRADRRAEMRFDYWAPGTPIHLLDKRWPLLEAVWNEVLIAVCDGTTTADPDTNLLLLAGVTEVDEDSATVDYNFAVDRSDDAYPTFAATIMVKWRPSGVDVSALQDFLVLSAEYFDPETDPLAADPIVEQDHRLHAFSSGFGPGFQ